MSKHFQPSLFSDSEIKGSGTSIFKFKKYIGTHVNFFEHSTYNEKQLEGIVTFIEKIHVDGNDMIRIELDGDGAFAFHTEDDVVSFFEKNLVLDEAGFNRLTRDKKVCIVSFSEIEATRIFKYLRLFTDYSFASVSVDAIPNYVDYDLYSLHNIVSNGFNCKKFSFVRDDFYQMVKEKESSKSFHINKNSELKTLCGKELEYLIDPQDVAIGMCSICKKCLGEMDLALS